MFYRQHRLVIDGKYSSGDGRIRRIKIPWGFRRESSGGTALKKTRAAKAKLKVQEFAEEKEDRDPQPQDLIQISRKNEGRQIRQKLYEVYHREKPR
jgi:hypothetical protein